MSDGEVRDLLERIHRQSQINAYQTREWKCPRCGRRFRCRPEHAVALADRKMEKAPTHCGLPMLLAAKPLEPGA